MASANALHRSTGPMMSPCKLTTSFGEHATSSLNPDNKGQHPFSTPKRVGSLWSKALTITPRHRTIGNRTINLRANIDIALGIELDLRIH